MSGERFGIGAARRVCAGRTAVLAILLALFTLWGVAPVQAHAIASSVPPAQQATAAPLSVRLQTMEPRVATPGKPVAVRLAVTNGSSLSLQDVRVEARLGQAGALSTRARVEQQAATVRANGVVVAGNTLTTALRPNETRVVDLTLPAASVRPNRSYGVLPLTFTASAGSLSAVKPSFLPFQSVKEYEPLSLAFAVPLTLDPDPALVNGSADAVRQAWLTQLAANGRLARIIDATVSAPVTWAVDPAVIGAGSSGSTPAPGAAAGTPTPGPAARAGSADPVLAAQRALEQSLRGGASTHPIWALPLGDPDLTALTRLGVTGGGLATIVNAPTTLAARLGLTGSGLPARVAWPVGTAPSAFAVEAISQAYGTSGPAVVLAPSTALDPDPDMSGPSIRRTSAGQPLLAYDAALSELFASADDPGRAAELTQRFLADTMALLAQSPGRSRTVLIAAPRTYHPDTAATQAIFDAITEAPWLQTTSTNTLFHQLGSPSAPIAQPLTAAKDPQSPGDSPLTIEGVRRVLDSYAPVNGLAEVLTPAADSSTLPTTTTLQALLSTRWRWAPTAWKPLVTGVHSRVESLTTGVTVQPSTINFFAEHGVVQVTVVNNLDVEVRNVRLVLDPQGRPPRLRVTQLPAPLTIRPNSRITVRVGVDAVAAGVAPVAAYLTTPSGTRLGTDATVRMRVQPTNGWLLLAIGGLAGVVFFAGLYRALRAGSPRISSADLKDIDLE